MRSDASRPLELRRPRRSFERNERDEGVTSPVKIAAISFANGTSGAICFTPRRIALKDARVGISLEFTPSCRASKKPIVSIARARSLERRRNLRRLWAKFIFKKGRRGFQHGAPRGGPVGERGAVRRFHPRISASRDLLVKATTLCPDAVEYWMALGEAVEAVVNKVPRKKLTAGRSIFIGRWRGAIPLRRSRACSKFSSSPGWTRRRSESRPGEDRKTIPHRFVGAGICARQAARSSAGEVAPVSDRRPNRVKERFAPMGRGALARERRR